MWGGIIGIVTVLIFGYLERGGPNMNSYACPPYCKIDHKHKEKRNESYSEYIIRKQTNDCRCYLRSGVKREGVQSHQRQCRYPLHRRVDRSEDN